MSLCSYGLGQKYSDHWDWFDHKTLDVRAVRAPRAPRAAGRERTDRPQHGLRSVLLPCVQVDPAKNSQRVATVLMFLSEVEEGGETVFPLKSEWANKEAAAAANFTEACRCGAWLALRACARPAR